MDDMAGTLNVQGRPAGRPCSFSPRNMIGLQLPALDLQDRLELADHLMHCGVRLCGDGFEDRPRRARRLHPVH